MSETLTSLPKDYRDLQGKTIFHDPILCAQFLRNNIDNPLLKKVQPEDIEDYTERFIPYFGTEFEGDAIKRICIKDNNKEYLFYLISLIEHKSAVDYNVAIQLLKYMVCIWAEYEKKFGTEYRDKVKNKEFRYPPIIPIVYYEGKAKWTAGRHLKDRIHLAEVFEDYVPDFTYELVDIHKISNQELLQRKDIMSLIMLLNKIQTPRDLAEFNEMSSENIDTILENVPEQVVDILISVIRTLCKRINATADEMEECVEKVRAGNMGYLFENMEPMDIQAERRKTAQAREERMKAEEERDKVKEERDKVKEERDKVKEERDKVKEERDKARKELVKTKEECINIEGELTKAGEKIQEKDEEIRRLRELLKKANMKE